MHSAIVVDVDVLVVCKLVVVVDEIAVFGKVMFTDSTSTISSSSSVNNNKIAKSSWKQHSVTVPLLSSISIINNSDSDSTNITPSSTGLSNDQSKVNSPWAFTEPLISPEAGVCEFITINTTINIRTINTEKYFLNQKSILFFLKYLIILLTSCSVKLDKCDSTLIWR